MAFAVASNLFALLTSPGLIIAEVRRCLADLVLIVNTVMHTVITLQKLVFFSFFLDNSQV